VGDVKGKIAHINKVPADTQRLIFNNTPLDEQKSLGDYKIDNDAIVLLVYKKEGTVLFLFFALLFIFEKGMLVVLCGFSLLSLHTLHYTLHYTH
jgi:Ubiquitin family